MAEGICKKMLKERNITDITCQSCGLAAFPGDEAMAFAVDAAKERGADISKHRARPLSQYILDKTDVMICMTNDHKEAIKSVKPNCKVFVPSEEISDPYGRDKAVYERCADELESYVARLLDALTANIVPMQESHVAEIAEIEKQCFSVPWSENGIRAELDDKTARFLVCVSGDRVLGYVGVHEVCEEAYIANIAVCNGYRRFGIGEELMESAEDEARMRGCEFISLEVRKSNESAVALYKKLGYNIAGKRKNFYSDPPEDALIMTLILKECES